MLVVSANTTSSPTSVSLVVSNNVVGIGATSPTSKLSISANGVELTGTACSSVFRLNGGALGTTLGSEISLASIGFTSGNHVGLGIRALRVVAGSDWYSTAIGLGMDVDNTVRAGGNFYLASRNVGIGMSNPLYTLHVNGSMKCSKWNVTQVMSNQVGPNTSNDQSILSANTFTTQGGTLLVYVSGSGYRNSGGDAFIQMGIYIRDTGDTATIRDLGLIQTYSNETGSHKCLVPRTFVVTGVAAGTYKIKFVGQSSIIIDSADYLNCTVTELPF